MKRSLSALAVALFLLAAPHAVADPTPAPSGGANANGGSTLTSPSPTGGFGVGEIVVTYTDTSRQISEPGRRPASRRLVTVIRYPADIASARVDTPSAAPARTEGPFPLIVFAHGFDITPGPYARLLQAWTRAGYVVAAPIFPLTNPGSPGGPDESDLVNQPADVSFVITRMLAADARPQGILSDLINPGEIAVSGQSDGGSTALAAAYNRHYADPRIKAAMILSGAMIPGLRGYDFAPPSPPLLAVQGTADTVNVPASTYHYFDRAPQPKFLLSLLHARHLGPYTNEEPELGIVERTTTAFLDRYLEDDPAAPARMRQAGNVPRLARLRR